jgi:hypothetical protein
LDRERAQENGVNQGENRGVGANAERQRRRSYQREHPAVAQQAERVTDILPEKGQNHDGIQYDNNQPS